MRDRTFDGVEQPIHVVKPIMLWSLNEGREQNTRTFEDVEKSADFLKSLLVRTLFGWSRTWGFTQCISIFDFVYSISV